MVNDNVLPLLRIRNHPHCMLLRTQITKSGSFVLQ